MGWSPPMHSDRDMENDFDEFVLRKLYGKSSEIALVAHYTSYRAFEAILQSKRLWMSNISSMNDIEEFVVGARLVRGFFDDKVADSGWDDNVISAIREQYDEIAGLLKDNIYCISFSAFDGAKRPHGTLALWQRYGENGEGVCFVFKSKNILLNQRTNDPIFWLPMIYRSEGELAEYFDTVFASLDDQYYEFLEPFGFDITPDEPEFIDFVRMTVRILLVVAMCHKNEAYDDELELRLAYSPALYPRPHPSIELLSAEIGGVARAIAAVDTETYRSATDVGIGLPDLIERILIGPDGERRSVREQAQAALRSAGLAGISVEYSKIPFRKRQE